MSAMPPGWRGLAAGYIRRTASPVLALSKECGRLAERRVPRGRPARHGSRGGAVMKRTMLFRRRPGTQLSATARAVAERAPQTLTVVRHRAQPTAVTIVRLTCTAVFAYLLALVLTSTPRPVLAPLTALLVVQVSLYQ